MEALKQIDLGSLPRNAQQEIYDFYVFVKQGYARNSSDLDRNRDEKIGGKMQIEEIFPRKLPSLPPFTRDQIYDR